MLTEEQACCRLEAPLFMFIRDNPELVKQLQDAAGGKPLPGIVEVHDD
jgi:alpha-D-ribose 1-methylphosphonate 5-triphosphate diphosphatase PhnM